MSRIFRSTRHALLLALVSIVFVACGSGGGDSSPPVPTPVVCTPFIDSFGRSVTCAEMNALAGANLAYLDAGGNGGTGVGDSAGDGSAGDGAPIANATLKFTDINGKEVTTTTDANGYYRINLRGLKAPLVATVLRNEKPWKSMLVADIVRAPANRNFYTINLTGLTDIVASEVAQKQGFVSADALTPAIVASQKQNIPQIVADLNASLVNSLKDAGLDAATFNPLTTPFVPDKTGYDLILENNPISRAPDGSTVLVNTKFSFTTGDQRVYRFTPSNGTPYTNTRTVLATVGTEVERLQNMFSNGRQSEISIYNEQLEAVSVLYSDGWNCNYTPPRQGFLSLAASAVQIGGSFTQSHTWGCVYSNGTQSTPTTRSETYTFARIESISTPAGNFPNARVWNTKIGLVEFTDWVDPVMNRSVLQKWTEVVDGVPINWTGELISYAIKNYPK